MNLSVLTDYLPDWLAPSVATFCLHLLVVFLLLSRWESSDSDRVIQARKITPEIINAKLVSIDEFRAKPAPKAPPKQPARTQPAAPKKQAAPSKPAPAPQSKPAAQKKPAETRRSEPAAAPAKEPEPQLDANALAELSRRQLSESMAAESAAEVAVTAEEMAASYAALIQRAVIGYWSRPPSARNGMEVLLSVQLIPSGDVISVSVVKSSGNAAFDRSAINAVERAGSFPELKNLPIREFEKSFRRFRLLFRPEDLRY
ncbi:cell envelope integrity protein TolA [Chromatocurvus halotolerans]|uniref:Cell division and transport-associated protein TolA n=1 Tax=Chromatocurvus halotolerans TaxID=1132028 RepID=A0A4R2KU28_9GAMM|nr:cell envelope integrity protein TolA [Chromatocurvus halotolerans]TCO77303.1 cell division and transport-associated protein TolA [Chromatocurvus halotolerans]